MLATHPAGAIKPLAPAAFRPGTLIAIGASTGGTEAIREFLARLPADSPPVAIVQHMPEMFTRLFARRLDDLCALKVIEVATGELLQPGHAYVAPGNWHFSVIAARGRFEARVDQEDPVNRHRPSVDVLFRSVANEGLGEMKRAGAATFAQDRASCVVYGMPKAAIDAGHADHVGPVETLAAKVVQSLRVPGSPPARDMVG